MRNLLLEERQLRQEKTKKLCRAHELLADARAAGAFTPDAEAEYTRLKREVGLINSELDSETFADSAKVYALGAYFLSQVNA
ncbi:MAG: hypothetical protein LAP85_10525 [Acidobacteriia bacterium]|nr:hypothetical protein [Terriglobia bacterium]